MPAPSPFQSMLSGRSDERADHGAARGFVQTMALRTSSDALAPGHAARDDGLPSRETGAVGHRVSSPDFVGRAEVLDLLESAFDEVAAGATATVLVGGDAGIGKTRLVSEFCRRVRDRGGLVATGVCVPADGGGLPFGPVVGLRRDVLRALGESATPDALGPVDAALGLDLPRPAEAGDVGSSGSRLVDELAKTRLFESILAGFLRLAERSAVVLVFEDLQWADSASAEFLGFLVRNLSDVKVLLIGTYRSEELGRGHPLRPWLSELGRHPLVTTLRLDGLDRDETASLIGGILGHQADWALVDAVSARAQGNPFFVEELTAARHSPTLSAELQGVIMARVERLTDEAQQLLRLAATAGPTVRHHLLEAVGLLDAVSLDSVLAETVDRQVLVVDPAEDGYRFRHALLREAVYAALLPGERSRWHRQVATALTTDPSLGRPEPGHRAAELAGHWFAAAEWAEAFTSSISAADAAIAVWAFPEALAHLERALSAVDRLPDAGAAMDFDRVQFLERAAEVAYLAGAGQRSVELAQATIENLDATADAVRAGRCYTMLGRNAWAIGDSEAAFLAYGQAAALLPAHPPSVELARVACEEARGLMFLSRFPRGAGAMREGDRSRPCRGCASGGGAGDQHLGVLPRRDGLCRRRHRPAARGSRHCRGVGQTR